MSKHHKYPAWRYHKDQPSKVIQGEHEEHDDWHDHPLKAAGKPMPNAPKKFEEKEESEGPKAFKAPKAPKAPKA